VGLLDFVSLLCTAFGLVNFNPLTKIMESQKSIDNNRRVIITHTTPPAKGSGNYTLAGNVVNNFWRVLIIGRWKGK